MTGPVRFDNALVVGYPSTSTFTIHVANQRVEAITPSTDLAPSISVDEVVDLEGKAWLGPSLVDAHVHFTTWSLTRMRLDLTHAVTACEVVELVSLEASKPTEDPLAPIIGRDYRVGKWPDIEEMTKENLDAVVTPGRPVALMSGDLHTMWLNTAGFRMVGLDPATETGVLREKPAFDAMGVLNNLSPEELDPFIEAAAKAAASRGCTEIVELEMTHNIANWRRRVGKGIDQLRVSLGLYSEHLGDATEHGLKSGDEIEGGKGLLKVGPYKIVTDGSLGARTAFCCSPYPHTTDHGLWIHPNATLQEMLQYGVSHGLKLAVHAIGDEANRRVIAALDKLDPPPLPGSSIEHAQLITLEDIPAFGKLGIIASIQPHHLLDDMELADRFWDGWTDRAFAYKTLVDAGVPIRMGSDAPVAPLEPFGSIAAAISRERAGEEGKGGWHPEQCISVEQAYQASTSNGKLTIEVGDVADLTITKSDPLHSSAKELRGMVVFGTLLGGRWTHREGI